MAGETYDIRISELQRKLLHRAADQLVRDINAGDTVVTREESEEARALASLLDNSTIPLATTGINDYTE